MDIPESADDVSGASVDARTPLPVIYADFPEWWLRITAPVATSWRRELLALAATLAAGIAIGLLVGLQIG